MSHLVILVTSRLVVYPCEDGSVKSSLNSLRTSAVYMPRWTRFRRCNGLSLCCQSKESEAFSEMKCKQNDFKSRKCINYIVCKNRLFLGRNVSNRADSCTCLPSFPVPTPQSHDRMPPRSSLAKSMLVQHQGFMSVEWNSGSHDIIYW